MTGIVIKMFNIDRNTGPDTLVWEINDKQERFGVQCLVKGYLEMWTEGIEPQTPQLMDILLYHLSNCCKFTLSKILA